jgi:hypothetical protein
MNLIKELFPSISLIKRASIICGVGIIIFSFPLQVIFKFKYVTAIGYILLFSLVLHDLKYFKERIFSSQQSTRTTLILLFVSHFFISESLHFFFYPSFSLMEFGRTFFNFIFPVSFFIFGVVSRTNFSIRSLILFLILWAGIINSSYMVIDNYQKFIAKNVGFYANMACNYVTDVNKVYLHNPYYEDISGRCFTNNRSFGLFESGAVSGCLNLFGYFSAIFLLRKRKALKVFLLSYLGFSILLSMNFTSIFAFIFLNLFLIVKNFKKGESRFIFSIFSISAFFGILIITLLTLFTRSDQLDFFLGRYVYSFKVLYDVENYKQSTYLLNFSNEISRFFSLAFTQNHIFLFGDGYSQLTNRLKGSDLGFIDSFYRFGFILGFTLIISFIILLYKTILMGDKNKFGPTAQFSLMIVATVIFMDLHYSVYISKSVLPILFFSIGFLPVNKNIRSRVSV